MVDSVNRAIALAGTIRAVAKYGNRHMVGEIDAEVIEDAIAHLRAQVIAFAGPHAVRYAEEFGLAKGELHPQHYDLLKDCGARMDDFRRAPTPQLTAEEK